MTMYAGEVLRHELAGGGGWGDPLERDAQLVLNDVRNELVSVERARSDYGVMVNISSWTVNVEKTAELREKIKQSRIGVADAVLWEDWPREEKNKGAQEVQGVEA